MDLAVGVAGQPQRPRQARHVVVAPIGQLFDVVEENETVGSGRDVGQISPHRRAPVPVHRKRGFRNRDQARPGRGRRARLRDDGTIDLGSAAGRQARFLGDVGLQHRDRKSRAGRRRRRQSRGPGGSGGESQDRRDGE